MEVIKTDITPHVQGALSRRPDCVVLHGSRSGLDRSVRAEFDSTRRYCVTNTKELAWHATIGEGAYSIHMSCRQWGYHIKEDSDNTVGVEFSQAKEGLPISDAQVAAFAHWYQSQLKVAWGDFDIAAPGAMKTHAEMPSGIRDGNTDVFARNDPRDDELRARILAAIGAGDAANAAFDAYLAKQTVSVRNAWGNAIYRGNLYDRAGWGGNPIPILRLERALLGYVNGLVVNLTGRPLDEWQDWMGSSVQRF